MVRGRIRARGSRVGAPGAPMTSNVALLMVQSAYALGATPEETVRAACEVIASFARTAHLGRPEARAQIAGLLRDFAATFERGGT